MEPQDVTGLPSKAHDDFLDVNYTDYLAPVWQKIIFDGKPHVLFFDEFSNTPRSVQAGLLKIIGEGRFANGQKIPENCFVVGAMNPESTAVDYTPIAAPMANRLLFVSYSPSDNEVYEGLSGGWYTEEEKAAWDKNDERRWRSRIVGFLRANSRFILHPNHLAEGHVDTVAATYLSPENESEESEREILTTTWASPRSWDNAARVLGNSGYANEVLPIQERILAGMVGRQAAVELAGWVHESERVDAFELIRNPSMQNWEVSSENPDSYNDILELAGAVVGKARECDGKNGRPSVADMLDFFDYVVDHGGAPVFASYFTGGDLRKALNDNRGDMSLKELTSRTCDILIKLKQLSTIDKVV
jgi:hypothetical protein